MERNIKYGVTGAQTLQESSYLDKQKSKQMDKYIQECGFFEDESEGQIRERVLGKINLLLKRFVKIISKLKKISSDENTNYGGKIFTFGSYRLGVHSKGSDIDVLCIVPRHVTRKEFFNEFYDMLNEEKEVKELTKIEEAYVPLIKMVYSNIPIDLTFARLNSSVVGEKINLLNDYVIKNMDDKCVLSINGSRVTDEILNLVPNVLTFHSALRCIKYWAKQRCIYGNSYGYFGGVAFSISVARICQLFPNASSYTIVVKFFEIFSNWKWPNPVILKSIVDLGYNMKVWDPKIYPTDKYHKMPVITPAYPSICSTHNITMSTQNLITNELIRGHDIMSKEHGNFQKLCLVSDFFNRYKLFIQVNAISDNTNHKLWVGFIESKIRILATKIEVLDEVLNAYPFPRAFEIFNEKLTNFSFKIPNVKIFTSFFIGLEFPNTKNKTIIIENPVKEFLEFINNYDKKEDSMICEVNSMKRRDVHKFLSVFYSKY
ncbi:poly polymerase [Vairimorpha apis BRL 01]|uniref:Poly(A) polymerase n=1 Tax=Vairimorpha apis BRL 01 TaxID=1037528 RepID=T0L0W5_9MICR|nr:poly polymerase [Vairimorpha apis BRL 01]